MLASVLTNQVLTAWHYNTQTAPTVIVLPNHPTSNTAPSTTWPAQAQSEVLQLQYHSGQINHEAIPILHALENMANQGEVPLEWVLECAARSSILLQELESAQQAATGHDSLPLLDPNQDYITSLGHCENMACRYSEATCHHKCKVSHPNALWHMDGHHKLVHWGIVIHGIIDGYCHTVVRLEAHINNQSSTVMETFLSAVK
ncbi:hypothetical protein BKA82DRAFT_4339055 [Pisolithus tinctorius]|nr:hypothetical protein BKA82DRAFT_4339055 [Pisolithus tinctorius]